MDDQVLDDARRYVRESGLSCVNTMPQWASWLLLTSITVRKPLYLTAVAVCAATFWLNSGISTRSTLAVLFFAAALVPMTTFVIRSAMISDNILDEFLTLAYRNTSLGRLLWTHFNREQKPE